MVPVDNETTIERCTVMKQVTASQYAKIHPYLPVQCGNVRISNMTFIKALLYVLENGCMRRARRPRLAGELG